MRPSDEVDERQLELARKAGDAYYEALQYMVDEVAHAGGMQEAGDYVVAFAQEEAEGFYFLKEGGLEWVAPDEENCHIEVAVLDADDHRFLPQLAIEATLFDGGGAEVATFDCPFLWHPGLFHYGRDVTVPGPGTYDLRLRIAAPTFARHDKTNGARYGAPVEVTFEGIDIETGQD